MKKLIKISLSIFITTILLLGFAVPVNIVGNWYQQFLPSLPNLQVSDMYFQDSLIGYIVTGNGSPNDSSGYILKTTNGGNNWILKLAEFRDFSRVKFINSNTGFVSGGYFNGARIYKTTNAGENWFSIGIPGGGQIYFNDMAVVSEDTILVVAENSLVGGVFRTTNSGASWQQQLFLGSQNPSRIYMYNARIGFVSSTAGLYKTTNSGMNWFNASNDFSFSDMFFIDSLIGWKASGFIKKTTNGGLNWVNQPIPQGGNILGSGAISFMNKDNDTIWAVGESIIVPGNPSTRGILFRTINGGNSWQYQLPDTAIHITRYLFGQFINKRIGWAYSLNPTGIHTTNGGDTTFITGITKISNEVPNDYKLFQNYPNPFNPVTNIRYSVKRQTSNVKLIVYDIQGKLITELVNQKQNTGTYEVDFSGNGYSSGVYFYSLIIEGSVVDTKKMILVK